MFLNHLTKRCNSTLVSKELRNTMRKVPLPVVIVTGKSKTSRGMTCSSFNSISLDPPIVSFAIKLPSKTRDLLVDCTKYAIHILSSDQIAQSVCFSSPTTQTEFHRFPHYINSNQIPILQGCMSVLECEPFKREIIGDHEIWYSQVSNVLVDGIKKKSSDGTNSYESLTPLLYYDSSYRNVGDELFIQAFESTNLDFAEWTHRAHLRMAWIYLRTYDKSIAYQHIRQGIHQYNNANIHLIKHGYNETITTFFCELLEKTIEYDSNTGEKCNDFIDFITIYSFLDDFSLIYRFYSKEYLYSEKCKLQYMPPDLPSAPTDILHPQVLYKLKQ